MMDSQTIFFGIYVLAAACYGLLVLCFVFSRKNVLINICLCMFVLHAAWALSSLFMRLELDPGVVFWHKVIMITLLLLPLMLLWFMSSFNGAFNKKLIFTGVVGTVICVVLALTDHIVFDPDVIHDGAQVVFKYELGWGMVFSFFFIFILLLLTFLDSLNALRGKAKAGGVKLIFAGNTFFLASTILSHFVSWSGQYPIDIIAGLINVVCLLVAIWQYHVLEFKFVLKKGGVLLFVIELIAVIYIYLFIKLETILKAYSFNMTPYVTPVLLILALLVFASVFSKFNDNLDKLFFATEYRQRQWLREFSVTLASKLGLDEITNTFVEAVKSVLRVRGVYLALYDEEQKEYIINITEINSKLRYAIAEDHPILAVLHSHDNMCLTREQIEYQPVFRALWDTEIELINELELELVAPLKSRSRVIGMLMLTKKQDDSPFSLEDKELLLSLGGSTAVALDNAFSYERAKKEANTDSLTGLYNHRFFYRELKRLTLEREENTLSLVLLDLDMFKLYNDMYGHMEGDRALETVAEILSSHVGKRGVVARYGGEEFVIILPGHDSKQAEALTEKIRLEVQRIFHEGSGSEKRFLSISAGVCTYPDTAPNGEELLRRADIALYSAKNSGKNKIIIYAPSIAVQQEKSEPDIYWMTVPGNELVSHASTIYALTATIETKDYYTYGHSQKVAEYATALASAIGLDDWHIKSIKEAALLHDIGKIGISEDILRKVGRLTEEELEVMRRHVDMSVTIIKHLPSLQYVLPAVVGHHEFWDGSGYPRSIRGENIPISARCLTIADSFDAMMSTRPYRAGCSLDYALNEIKDKAGIQFDPALANAFIELTRSGIVDVTPYSGDLAEIEHEAAGKVS